MAASIIGGMCQLCWGLLPLKYPQLIFLYVFKVLKQLTEVLNDSPVQMTDIHYICVIYEGCPKIAYTSDVIQLIEDTGR